MEERSCGHLEFFESLHVETTKDIREDDIEEDLERILAANGYQIVGGIGKTIIPKKEEIHKAWEEHYTAIKSAW